MTDICLILEGTYPYVSGGVSSWVNDLIKRLDDTTFSVVYLGAHQAKDKKMHYLIPDNVHDFYQINVYDYLSGKGMFRKKHHWRPMARSAAEKIESFLERMQEGDTALFDELLECMSQTGARQINLSDLTYSWESWQILEKFYHKRADGVSFIDFFWTWRALYLPFFSLFKVKLPEARVYHAISTGYAGVLGAMAKARFNRPFLLTEHGIYTRERKIDIAQADWIYSELAHELKVVEENDFFKDWWMRFFMFLSYLAYERADEVVTLYEGNRLTQLEEGADPQKTRIIPNGVNIVGYQVNARKNSYGPFKVGFVGRVVPIKDVKTFIAACQNINNEIQNVEFYILGPTDEDEEYYQECVQLTKMKSLENVIHFTGEVKMRDYYPQLDVIVLTSISEAQPLVLLEAAACGIAVVATDVGACPELINGRSGDDRLLGQSGLVTSICNPQETAQAVIQILKNPELRRKMGEAGRKRVAQYYQQNDFIANYQELYNRYIDQVSYSQKTATLATQLN